MKKRRAETLIEFLMAVSVFGIIMAGVFEFVASQTAMLARIKARDEMIYQAQYCMNYYYRNGALLPERNGVKFEFDNSGNPKILTVSKNNSVMTFEFKE